MVIMKSVKALLAFIENQKKANEGKRSTVVKVKSPPIMRRSNAVKQINRNEKQTRINQRVEKKKQKRKGGGKHQKNQIQRRSCPE